MLDHYGIGTKEFNLVNPEPVFHMIIEQLFERSRKLKELHISVEKENTASVKVIQKNGGVYERSFSFENETADIYRIAL